MRRLITKATIFVGAGLLGLVATGSWAANGPGVSDKEILICSYQPMTGKVSS